MVDEKLVRVRVETWERLVALKSQPFLSTFDAVVTFLLNEHQVRALKLKEQQEQKDTKEMLK